MQKADGLLLDGLDDHGQQEGLLAAGTNEDDGNTVNGLESAES
jgi:hypothetical protein